MKSPWVIRLEQEIEDFNIEIIRRITSGFSGVKKYPLGSILQNALS